MTLSQFFSLRSAMFVPRRHTPFRSRRGFSILELVVVLVLIGIVTAISGGRLSAMRDQQRLNRGATTIQTQLEKAFALAGRNRAPILIKWNSTALTLDITDRSAAMSYGSVNLKASDFGFHSGEVTATRAATEVYPNGFASDTLSLTITATRGPTTYTKRIRMSRAGLVKVI